MKKVLITTALTTLILTACSSAPQTKTETVALTPPTTTKTVVYNCQAKKTLTATYTFVGQDVKSAHLKLGKKALGEFSRDMNASADFTTFVAGDYSWNTDAGLTLTTFNQTEGVHLFKKGKKSDEIVAKSCQLNTKATAKLNP